MAAPILGGVSLITGGIAAGKDASGGNWGAATLDTVGALPGLGAEFQSIRALGHSRDVAALDDPIEASIMAGDNRGLASLQELQGALFWAREGAAGWGELLGWLSAGLADFNSLFVAGMLTAC